MSLLDSASLIVTPNGFKAGKLYSIVPATGAGDLDVTRATTATRVNSSGLIESVASNVPRLDYSNGSCPSILVEPQRTNLLLRSEEFESAAWGKVTASVTANTTTAPDGTLNADLLTPNAVTFGLIQQTANITANVPNTFSVYAKYNGISSFQLQTRDNANNANFAIVNFDILTGVVLMAPSTSGAYSNASATIESVGNGWYRLSLTSTSNISVTSRFRLVSDLSDGINGYFIWGAQLEAGAYPTSYIPTTSASVTRNADVISKTGISSLIGQTEGTIFVDFDNLLQTTYGNEYLISLYSDGVNQIWIRKEIGSNTYTARVFASGSTAVTMSQLNFVDGQNKVAFTYKSGESAVYLNGNQIATNTDAFTLGASISQLGLANLNNTLVGYQKIKSAALWKTRLSNAELATLTTL
jgi:hypothetical protein